MTVPLAQTVVELEALACRRAVQFAMKISLVEVTFEGDSATVIQAISEGILDSSAFGHIVDDIRMLAEAFQFSLFTHVPRNCNVLADSLAKKAKTIRGTQVWLDSLPKDIAHLVSFDVH